MLVRVESDARRNIASQVELLEALQRRDYDRANLDIDQRLGKPVTPKGNQELLKVDPTTGGLAKLCPISYRGPYS
jgi:hypothetical protein